MVLELYQERQIQEELFKKLNTMDYFLLRALLFYHVLPSFLENGKMF